MSDTSLDSPSLVAALKEIKQRLTKTFSRHLVWMTIEETFDSFEKLLTDIAFVYAQQSKLYVGESFDLKNQSSNWFYTLPNQLKHYLGKEYHLVIYDVREGLSPNALGIVAGLVQGGGLLILISSPTHQWQYQQDKETRKINSVACPQPINQRFTKRFIEKLYQDSSVVTYFDLRNQKTIILNNDIRRPSFDIKISKNIEKNLKEIALSLSIKIQQVPQCILLQADRGRGKSSLLGRLARHLLSVGKTVVLIAPEKNSVVQVFNYAQMGDGLEHKGFVFKTPEKIIQESVDSSQEIADVILVDEASRIPFSVLIKLQELAPSIIYSTTLHGYEGTSRSFSIKFYNQLQNFRRVSTIVLRHPLRWRDDDPLEDFFEKVLLLNLDKKTNLEGSKCLNQTLDNSIDTFYREVAEDIILLCIDQNDLIQDENLLLAVYALLHNAHYQTSPNDLRFILDANDLDIFVLLDKRNQPISLIGVLLGVREGCWTKDEQQEILNKKRRFKGEFLPQTLLNYEGYREATDYAYARILRIAVQENQRSHGFGQALIHAYKDYLLRFSIDFIGTSFGYTSYLKQFWEKTDFKPVRISQKKDHVSNAHSLVMLSALSLASEKKLKGWHLRYLEKNTQLPNTSLNAQDIMDIRDYCEGTRAYASCRLGICKWVVSYIKKHKVIDDNKYSMVFDKVIHEATHQTLVAKYQLANHKAVDKLIREWLQQVANHLLVK